jgi:hypothetical protein
MRRDGADIEIKIPAVQAGRKAGELIRDRVSAI